MAKQNVEMNHYLLKGNFKNESWLLRNNKTLFGEDEKGRRRRMRYCEGESSIYYDEQNPDSEPTFLAFEHGSLLVNKNDKTRNLFVQKQPEFGEKFYLFNEQDEAVNELAKLKEEDEVRSMLSELNLEQKEAIAIVLFGLNVVQRWSSEKIELECYKFLKSNPMRMKEVINDPATELIYLVAGALSLGVIEISADKTSIRWSDSRNEIIPIPRGVNPLTEMSQFLRTTDALVTLQEIGDRINAKKGGKVIKKTAKANG